MKYFVGISLIIFCQSCAAQKKLNTLLTKNIKQHIEYLASDKLEGRRTGTAGEKLAATYIINEYKKNGISAYFPNNNFLQPFEINAGKEHQTKSAFIIGDMAYAGDRDYFPLAYSANFPLTKLENIKADITLVDIAAIVKENENNPHYDLQEKLISICKAEASKGKKLVVFKNSSKTDDKLTFNENDKTETLPIAALYVKPIITETLDASGFDAVQLQIELIANKKLANNIIASINNNAKHTIVLGAHYDHLGYGEDKNSLYSGATPMIHNGADDNASGTAALLELAKMLKKSKYKKYNYVFAHFSGEELGLYGSKYFAENAITASNVNYMINMDMVGRLSDSSKGITIGGYGTSPSWGKLVTKQNQFGWSINLDSSGVGPSDHTSFYRKDIPVLFFFTGSHKDYHKPSDDADKINYLGTAQIVAYINNLIAATEKMEKLSFTKTREASMGKSSFKVSLGIMPDYTFSGAGVLVDGVSENKPAQKAGIQKGDIITQLGSHKFTDVQSYMGALNKFNKGETTTATLQRAKNTITVTVTF
jgi:aminopeptidase YwaD